MDILKNWRWWVGVGFLIAFFVFAWFLRALVFYVIISGVLSILFEPLVNKLRGLKLIGKGIPAGVVAFLVLLLIWGILALIISITIPIAAQEIRVLSSLDYDGITSKIQEMLSVFDGFLRDYGVLSGEGSSVMLQERIRSFFDLNNLTSIFGGFLSGIGNVFVAFFSISFIKRERKTTVLCG